MVELGIEPRTSLSVDRNSDHETTRLVKLVSFPIQHASSMQSANHTPLDGLMYFWSLYRGTVFLASWWFPFRHQNLFSECCLQILLYFLNWFFNWWGFDLHDLNSGVWKNKSQDLANNSQHKIYLSFNTFCPRGVYILHGLSCHLSWWSTNTLRFP
jgi:hypothetical protein